MNPAILVDNAFLDGVPTATDTASGYDVLNIRDLKVYTAWRAAFVGTKYLTVNCGAPRTVDTIGISGHNLGTAGATVSVESSANGIDWTERLAGFVPTNDKSIMKKIPSVSAQYWRLKVVTASIDAQIAVCLLGVRLEFPVGVSAPFTPAEESIEAENIVSKTGVLLGAVVRYNPIAVNAQFRWVGRTWVEAIFLPWWNDWASKLAPFLWAWDLDRYPNDVKFLRITPGFSMKAPVSVGPFYDSISLEMEGVKE